MVTSLGRTGTTLLMSLLASHPAVVAHRTHPYEIFQAKYWLHVLRVLAEPANHGESSRAEDFGEDIWRVGHNPFHTAPITDDPDLIHLLGRSYVERLAAFCQKNIDDFYLEVAKTQAQHAPTFFAEKFHPDHVPRIAWELYPDAREVILVRDGPDVICSVFAFNRKRNTVGFGRDRFASDEEYVFYVGKRARRLLEDWKTRSAESQIVRYEDLVNRPTETVTGILEYLGLDRRSETVEGLVQRAFESPGLDDHRTSQSVEKSVGRWRSELPHSLRGVCDEALGPVLAEFGYDETRTGRAWGTRTRASRRSS